MAAPKLFERMAAAVARLRSWSGNHCAESRLGEAITGGPTAAFTICAKCRQPTSIQSSGPIV
jgi:hypothetical protein